MTESESTKSRLILNFDQYKHQEWLRRRRLRIEQVRKQSNDLAKMLREKGMNEEKAKEYEKKRRREAELMFWKAVKLEELEEKFSYALEEFGKGHKLAEEEPAPEEVIEARNKINFLKAQERGEVAQQEELKRKKLELAKKRSNIMRKKMTRKIEDLRSALIRSVPVQKQLVNLGEDQDRILEEAEIDEENLERKEISKVNTKAIKPKLNQEDKEFIKKKVILKKVRKKKFSEACKTNTKKSKNLKSTNFTNTTHQEPQVEPVWINLNDVMSSSGLDTGRKNGNNKTKSSQRHSTDEKEKPVIFYNYTSRSYCKSFKDFPQLVEKIDPRLEPNANELAKLEEKEERLEVKRRQEMEKITQERGAEALKKEKINRDYNNLMAKLEELHKKEKILKAQQKIPPSLIHMNDKRLSERTKSRQKIMDSKFESILYEATAGISLSEPRTKSPEIRYGGCGDFNDLTEQSILKLSFSPSNLKTNSPVTSASTSIDEKIHHINEIPHIKAKKKKKLLANIDRALKEGRQLRKTVSQNQVNDQTLEENNFEEDISKSNLEDGNRNLQGSKKETLNGEDNKNLLPQENEKPKNIIKNCDREVQTDLIGNENGNLELDFKPLDTLTKAVDESVPDSTSTSYKSLPSAISSCKFRQFLKYLENLSDSDNNSLFEVDPKIKKKIKSVSTDLVCDSNSSKARKIRNESFVSQNLEYYILKLLNMSRECIAELSVSSENLSTPTVSDLYLGNENNFYLKSNLEPEHSCQISPKEENLMRTSRLKRAADLEKAMKNWRTILETNDRPSTNLEQENQPDFSYAVPLHSDLACDREPKDLNVIKPSNINDELEGESKYDRISRKCSERISALSELLNKVRKDKEKLLFSTSGTSSLSLKKYERSPKENLGKIKQGKEVKDLCDERDSKLLELDNFFDSYNFSEYKNDDMSMVAVFDPLSPGHSSTSSSDSFPDVIDELLKRKVLTSPFKWSEGHNAIDLTAIGENLTKPSSIETVIGNFRKEMFKVKPVSFISSDSYKGTQTTPSNSPHLLSKNLKDFHPTKYEENAEKKISEESYQEESSIDSINHALTSLGLNWAKTFLRKNEESKALSTSSNSDEEQLFVGKTRNYY